MAAFLVLLLLFSLLFFLSSACENNNNRTDPHFVRVRTTCGTRTLNRGDQEETAMHKRTPAFDEEQHDSANDAPYLSAREIEILGLVAEGRTDNEIAMQLCISAKTVSWYVKEIRTRLDARSRTHAVAMVLRQGILPGKRSPDTHS
jgi:DNA-binding CsgD family transcriptional regulator